MQNKISWGLIKLQSTSRMRSVVMSITSRAGEIYVSPRAFDPTPKENLKKKFLFKAIQRKE